MAVTLTKTIEVGDIVTYTDFLGGTRVVLVKDVSTHKGRDCFDGPLLADPSQEVWGYHYQVTHVKKGGK